MSTFLVRRLLHLIPVVFGISILTFLLTRMSGDPAMLMLGPEATAAALESFREEYGLDDPITVQYVRFLGQALQGDFGRSIRYREPALDLFLERVPATLQLAAASMLLALGAGIPIGIVAALGRGSWLDNFARLFTLFGQAVPTFYTGLMLIIIVGVRLRWLPTGGRGDGELKHLILPAVTLAAYLVALIARFTRSNMLEVLGQDYVRTARAKGLREAGVVGRHVLKNAMLPVVTVVGLQIGGLLSGAVITETVFAWPGIGRLAVQAVSQRDFPVVQVTVMLTSVAFVMSSLVVDVLYGYLDPRLRLR